MKIQGDAVFNTAVLTVLSTLVGCGADDGEDFTVALGCNPSCTRGQVCRSQGSDEPPSCVAVELAPEWPSIQLVDPGAPGASFGASCAANADCQSGLCVDIDSEGQCSQRCLGFFGECPDGAQCEPAGAINVCVNGGGTALLSGARRVGAPCGQDTECASGACIENDSGRWCSQPCDISMNECPAGTTCQTEAERAYCLPPQPPQGAPLNCVGLNACFNDCTDGGDCSDQCIAWAADDAIVLLYEVYRCYGAAFCRTETQCFEACRDQIEACESN